MTTMNSSSAFLSRASAERLIKAACVNDDMVTISSNIKGPDLELPGDIGKSPFKDWPLDKCPHRPWSRNPDERRVMGTDLSKKTAKKMATQLTKFEDNEIVRYVWPSWVKDSKKNIPVGATLEMIVPCFIMIFFGEVIAVSMAITRMNFAKNHLNVIRV